MKETRLREELCLIGKSLFDRGLTFGSSGNLSVRTEDGWLLTPTNIALGRLDPATLAKVDDEGRLLSGAAPTKEFFLHLVMYRCRPQSGAVIHLHSTHSVAVSCIDGLDPANVLPPITAYYAMRVGKLPLIPYFRPGDPKLAAAVEELAGRHHAVLLANHGPVVAGTSLDAAMNAIEELEETAKLFLLLRHERLHCLTPEQVADIEREFRLR